MSNKQLELFTTNQAATYLGYKSKSGIIQAVRRGHLKPYGRRGEKGTYLFRLEDLHAMIGVSNPLGTEEGVSNEKENNPTSGDLQNQNGLSDKNPVYRSENRNKEGEKQACEGRQPAGSRKSQIGDASGIKNRKRGPQKNKIWGIRSAMEQDKCG